jgi:hypothetical protein
LLGARTLGELGPRHLAAAAQALKHLAQHEPAPLADAPALADIADQLPA